MSQGLRFKFIGTQFTVQTGVSGVSPSPSISAISLTNPIIVSTSPQAHGLVTGDVAKIYGITAGPTNLNGRLFAIDNATTLDFDLAGENGTANMAWSAGGKVDEIAFGEFCELDGVAQQDGGTDEHEVTTICSTAKEFVAGLGDSGTLQLDYNYAPGSTVQIALVESRRTGSDIAYKIVLPDSGGTVIMIGHVQSISRNGSVSGVVWRGSASIKLTGPVFEL